MIGKFGRVKRVVALSVLTTLALASPASADEIISSYTNWSPLSYQHTGDKSRRWTDPDTTTLQTQIFVTNCTYSRSGQTRHGLRLRRYDTFSPDEDYGTKDFYCSGTTDNNVWGRQGSGSFYFSIYSINADHNSTAYVSTPKVRWIY